MSGELFRKAALEKLSTPDQLDRLVVITHPRGWLALLAAALAIATGLIWGVFGTISYKVSGTGMLIKTGGLFNISHDFTGKIIDIRVREGDFVKEGDVVARIDQSTTLNQIVDLRKKLKTWSRRKKKPYRITLKVILKISNISTTKRKNSTTRSKAIPKT